MAVEEVSELEYAPHNAEAFAFRCGIVFLSRAEATAPIAKQLSCTVRLLLQQGASELVGAGVDIDHHFAFGLRQGHNWWCEKRLAEVFKGREGCVGWFW